MATYNTAFGSLPTPKSTLTNGSSFDGYDDDEENRKRDFWQQTKNQQAAESKDAQPPQTFAQMQEAGQARPAPSMVAQPAPAQPALVQNVAQTLGVQAPSTTPKTTSSFLDSVNQTLRTGAPPPPPANAPAGPGVVETIPSDIDRYTYDTRNPPPPNAPNGSTFTDANGFVWTRRGGVWGAEAGQSERMTGYQGLQPLDLMEQTQSGLPTGASSRLSDIGGFFQRFGIPANDSEWQLLAANTGMSIEALKKLATDGRYRTQQGLRDVEEERGWMAENGIDRIPWDMVYVPASQGGPGLRYKTYAEAVSSGYQPYGGETLYNSEENRQLLRRNTGMADLWSRWGIGAGTGDTGGGQTGGPTGGPGKDRDFGGGGTTGGTRPWDLNNNLPPVSERGPATGGPTPGNLGGVGPGGPATGGPTPGDIGGFPGGGVPGGGLPSGVGGGLPVGGGGGFAGSVPLPGAFGLSDRAVSFQNELLAALRDLRAAPSPFDSEAYRQALASGEAELTSQFASEAEKLDEEMARRGIFSSSIAGGEMGELRGRQARAMAGLRSELLREAANQMAERQQVMLTNMNAAASMLSDQEIRAFNADLDRYKASTQFELDARRLQQEAQISGQELSLQAARDAALARYQQGQLDLQLKEIVSREGIAGAERSQQMTIAQMEDKLRRDLGTSGERSGILQALLGSLDLSGLTPEELQAIFQGAGININLPSRPTTTPTPTGQTGPTGGNTGGGPGSTTNNTSAPPNQPNLGVGLYPGQIKTDPVNGRQYRWVVASSSGSVSNGSWVPV